MAKSDFPRPYIIGYGSSPSRCGGLKDKLYVVGGFGVYRTISMPRSGGRIS
jgi:hypothetical protein